MNLMLSDEIVLSEETMKNILKTSYLITFAYNDRQKVNNMYVDLNGFIKYGQRLLESDNIHTKSLGWCIIGWFIYKNSIDLYGKKYTSHELYVEALLIDRDNYMPYIFLGLEISDDNYEIINGEKYNKIKLLYEGLLKYNSNDIFSYILNVQYSNEYKKLCASFDSIHIVYINTLKCISLTPEYASDMFRLFFDNDASIEKIRQALNESLERSRITAKLALEKHKICWKINDHYIFGGITNQLFAKLLLGIQMLEEKQVLCLAHQIIFEDMLTFWTHNDDKDAVNIYAKEQIRLHEETEKQAQQEQARLRKEAREKVRQEKKQARQEHTRLRKEALEKTQLSQVCEPMRKEASEKTQLPQECKPPRRSARLAQKI